MQSALCTANKHVVLKHRILPHMQGQQSSLIFSRSCSPEAASPAASTTVPWPPCDQTTGFLQLVADGDPVMNVDCLDLLSFDPTVYQQMVSYPAEVMTIMDSEAQKLARQFQTEEDLADEDEDGLGGLGILVFPSAGARVIPAVLLLCI